MTIESIAQCLELVRWRGTDRFSARCPAHEDRNPSLSVREGERGLLVKCWAGCSLNQICQALGVEPKDLFFDSLPSKGKRKAPPPRPKRYDWRRYSTALERASEAHWLRADGIFRVARRLHSTSWDEDRVWQCLTIAFRSLQIAITFERVAFLVRQRGLQREAQAEMRRKAA